MVYIIPREDRAGRFKAKISKVKRAIEWCLIQKQTQIFTYDRSEQVAKHRR